MHNKIYFHKDKFNSKWIYLDLFGFRPFTIFKHGGYFYLNWSWFNLQLQRIIFKSIR